MERESYITFYINTKSIKMSDNSFPLTKTENIQDTKRIKME